MEAEAAVRALARQAERIVRDQRGQEVVLHAPALIAQRQRSLVARCAVAGWSGVESVVVKQNKGDDARGFTDWASLAFLSPLMGVAPRFYAGAVEDRIMVIEDLGGSRSLEDVLGQGAQDTVAGILEALAVTMARLVAATAGQEARFEGLRVGLPGAAGLGRREEAARWLAAGERIARWAAAFDLALPRGFEAACGHIAEVYAHPGTFLAFSHGDPAPSNNHIGSTGVRLVDFEYGGYRHALYDLTAWEVLCPLPLEWVAVLERAFRGALGADPLSAWAGDEGQYTQGRAVMCAYRGLAMLTWLAPEILEQDRAWAPGWTQRQAVVSTALRLRRATTGSTPLGPIAEFSAALGQRVQARWPELGDGAPSFRAPPG